MTIAGIDGTFDLGWTAETLPLRPMILPRRQFVYPAQAEEVERGALEVLVKPRAGEPFLATCALGYRDATTPTGVWAMPDPDWMCAVSGGYAYLICVPQPERFVFVRYRPVLQVLPYLPDASDTLSNTQDYTQDYRQDYRQDKSSEMRELLSNKRLLLFVGHHSILAWGREGEAWESDRLSWEGITVDRIEAGTLYGHGWDLMTDRDLPFALDLATGRRI